MRTLDTLIVNPLRGWRKGTMEYPKEFSIEAQATVEQERILANDDFAVARDSLRSNPYGTELPNLIRRYVIRVVLAFAKEACNIGRNRIWTVAQVESKVDDFMAAVALDANIEKRFHSNGTPLEAFWLMDSWSPGTITSAEMHKFRSLPEWKEYQTLLLEVASIQKMPVSSSHASEGPVGIKLKQLREEAGLTKRPTFPLRAQWIKDRLKERGWDRNDIARSSGPDVKTVQKILDANFVRESGLEKLVVALNHKKFGRAITLLDVPSN